MTDSKQTKRATDKTGRKRNALGRFTDGAPGPGRPKVTRQERDLRAVIRDIVDGELDKVAAELERIRKRYPTKYVSLLAKLSEYVLPRLQAVAHIDPANRPVAPTFSFTMVDGGPGTGIDIAGEDAVEVSDDDGRVAFEGSARAVEHQAQTPAPALPALPAPAAERPHVDAAPESAPCQQAPARPREAVGDDLGVEEASPPPAPTPPPGTRKLTGAALWAALAGPATIEQRLEARGPATPAAPLTREESARKRQAQEARNNAQAEVERRQAAERLRRMGGAE